MHHLPNLFALAAGVRSSSAATARAPARSAPGRSRRRERAAGKFDAARPRGAAAARAAAGLAAGRREHVAGVAALARLVPAARAVGAPAARCCKAAAVARARHRLRCCSRASAAHFGAALRPPRWPAADGGAEEEGLVHAQARAAGWADRDPRPAPPGAHEHVPCVRTHACAPSCVRSGRLQVRARGPMPRSALHKLTRLAVRLPRDQDLFQTQVVVALASRSFLSALSGTAGVWLLLRRSPGAFSFGGLVCG